TWATEHQRAHTQLTDRGERRIKRVLDARLAALLIDCGEPDDIGSWIEQHGAHEVLRLSFLSCGHCQSLLDVRPDHFTMAVRAVVADRKWLRSIHAAIELGADDDLNPSALVVSIRKRRRLDAEV